MTADIKPIHANRTVDTYFGDQQRRHDGERKKPFVPKGHDRQLSDNQKSGAVVTVYTTGGDVLKGKIIRRDRYTLTLEPTAEAQQGNHMMVFKSAIESIAYPAIPVRVFGGQSED